MEKRTCKSLLVEHLLFEKFQKFINWETLVMSKFTHTLAKYQTGKKLLKANLKNMEQSAQLQCQQNNDIVISHNFFF